MNKEGNKEMSPEPVISHWDGKGNALLIYADETVHIQNGKVFARLPLDKWVEAALSFSEASTWIPWPERKPEDARPLLVYVVHESHPDEGGAMVAFYNGIAWFASSGGMLCRPSKITHWMPLPEAPK